jgi:hypothetical protein
MRRKQEQQRKGRRKISKLFRRNEMHIRRAERWQEVRKPSAVEETKNWRNLVLLNKFSALIKLKRLVLKNCHCQSI